MSNPRDDNRNGNDSDNDSDNDNDNDGNPRFGRLLVVLLAALAAVVLITFASEAWFT